MIFTHYLRRALMDPVGMLCLFALPLMIIFINSVILVPAESMETMIDGYNLIASGAAAVMLAMFQLMGGAWIADWIFDDFRGDRRWRLFSAPISRNSIIFPAAAASWVFTMLQGIFIVIVSALLFNVYWGNLWVLAAVIVIMATMSQLMYILISLFVSKKRTAEAIPMVLTFAMTIMGGFMFGMGDNAVFRFLTRIQTPIVAAQHAILNSGFIFGNDMSRTWRSLIILTSTLAVLFVATAIAGRRRKI